MSTSDLDSQPIRFRVRFTAREDRVDELLQVFEQEYVPALTMQRGFLSARILLPYSEAASAGIGAKTSPDVVELEFDFASEDHRLEWVEQPIHQALWSHAAAASAHQEWSGFHISGGDATTLKAVVPLSYEARDKRFLQIVDSNAPITVVADGFLFTEGIVWDEKRGRLIFSDIPGDTMYQIDDGLITAPYRTPSNMGNGNCWDHEGRLVTCEHATSRVVREEKDGSVSVIADSFEGAELNSPNDVIAASDGTILFTDPTYGREGMFGVARPLPREERSVYAVLPSGEIRCLADDFRQPNGLVLTDDEQTLFVNDTERSHIRRFSFHGDSVSGGEVWAEVSGEGDGAADGLKIDAAGNLYCTGPGGIHVFAPDATLLGIIRIPKGTANFTWGGSDLKTLYVCGGTTIYAVALSQAGR